MREISTFSHKSFSTVSSHLKIHLEKTSDGSSTIFKSYCLSASGCRVRGFAAVTRAFREDELYVALSGRPAIGQKWRCGKTSRRDAAQSRCSYQNGPRSERTMP